MPLARPPTHGACRPIRGAGPPVAGLLNRLCCFDLWDRITGRWIFRLPKDEQEKIAKGE
ncbi:hypothetical protein [Geothrix terrae]|uniref:hypothetical protein n=1 Tax=Geothrix terrae TaxID=2922720 RepID=UPI001FAD7E1D|nr:hypothetical protein [Geothrix terrae]